MSTGRIVLYGLLGSLATFWAASCQGPQEFFRDNAIGTGTGGVVSTGGEGQSAGGGSGTGGTVVTGSGGTGTGGMSATGGSPATGGVSGAGGIAATGGVPGTGGIVATGGVSGAGGHAIGGAPGTGGIAATGGVPGTGGHATGGVTGTGGMAATGGTTGAAGSMGTVKNCADAIKLAGYAAGTAPPCSACKENGVDKSTNCKKVIDCLDTNFPCGSKMSCFSNCNNTGQADSIVTVCVNKLLTAGACVQP